MTRSVIDANWMQRAIEIAQQGLGNVEPNPMVGCVIANGEQLIAEGYHEYFGQAHAEVNALANVASDADLSQASMYVTLEPCCHHGKTPPCTTAIIDAGIKRVVVATTDPSGLVNGNGIELLKAAGIEVLLGICEPQANTLIAPYVNFTQNKRPWIIAKWAMTLDGKIATTSGSSQWISNEESRAVVHQLRGRMDAILVGNKTASCDNPQLTARPIETSVKRQAIRVVLAQTPALQLDSRLVCSADEIPVIVTAGPDADSNHCQQLVDNGVEVLAFNDNQGIIDGLLSELHQRNVTNLLVEGGSQLLGSLFDNQLIDEVHVFIAPSLIGGTAAPAPLSGNGIEQMTSALKLINPQFETLGDNIYVSGRTERD
ncbi:MAG: bifunctional diaminohydroxyphosphoribosylaminopyrimidine deaminase/5-amino-6-(5-phosphoribosylamino)uracil reductase RibD [Planctomycetaceae bacterium]|jgi:diaminohydroxyphosphoribosylaminopyrimidine deaminase / 5-amino-6-(5-phosphoribosylamino)uracil reductase|nr:bifunctional diaminohydroxyphosphoribosylaminopyrimidine deaminase/5-amino-6-(5-phosphoribosylamino)uracil reductase RibD [Planctomycetaceae bacterium]